MGVAGLLQEDDSIKTGSSNNATEHIMFITLTRKGNTFFYNYWHKSLYVVPEWWQEKNDLQVHQYTQTCKRFCLWHWAQAIKIGTGTSVAQQVGSDNKVTKTGVPIPPVSH